MGVIGAGSWTVASHLPTLAGWRDRGAVELSIVNRRDPEPLARIQAQFGFRMATTDWHEVIAAEPDIVLVATPPSLHAEQTRQALLAGAHVLCEKPFTLDPQDAWDLAAIAERTARTLVIAYGWNYRPMAVEAHRLGHEPGALGDIEHVSMHMDSFTRELLSGSGGYAMAAAGYPPRSETWTQAEVSGGGYGQAQLTHLLGLGLWLTGLRGEAVFALMKAAPGASVELHDAFTVRFRNGAIGTVSGASGHRGAAGHRQAVAIRVVGSRGMLHVDLRENLLWRYERNGREVRVSLPPDAGSYDCRGPVDAVVAAALRRSVPNRSPADLGARTVEILDAAYRSARSGRLEPMRSPGASIDT